MLAPLCGASYSDCARKQAAPWKGNSSLTRAVLFTPDTLCMELSMSLTQIRILVVQLTIAAFVIADATQGQQIKSAIFPAVPDVARPLPLSAVRLTGGPLKHAQEMDAEYLL